MRVSFFCLSAALVGVLGLPIGANAEGVTFTNISGDPSVGIEYSRTRSVRDEEYSRFFDPVSGEPRTDIPIEEAALAPSKSRGAPGVCILDFDGDGDEDIYVTNGPGTPNSLFSNQRVESGSLSFQDVAAAVGVALTEIDSSGCVYGDIDNDGDRDLYVLSSDGDNVLLENAGDGSYADITVTSGTGGAARASTSASLCDVNGDGLLDINVANLANMENSLFLFLEPTALNQHNQLFLNLGGNVFADVTSSSGLEDLDAMRMLDEGGEIIPIPGQPAGPTWAIACVDFDLDGDADILNGDDQAGVPPIGDPPSPFGGPTADRGLVHIFENDGHGNFVDVLDRIETPRLPGSWMGLSFGDYDADGAMDFFGSNFGDANISLAFGAPLLGVQPSRWFLGDDAGGFVDALSDGSIPGVISTPFGWGTSSVDYDNDGDTDILFVGDIQAGPLVTSSNPVAVWDNDGAGNFSANLGVLDPESADLHKRSAEHGMAAGDLNGDGFLDFVTVSNFVIPAEFRDPLPPPIDVPLLLPNPFDFGGAYDVDTEFMPTFVPTLDPNGIPTGDFTFIPAFLEVPNGVLNVEINNGDNGFESVRVTTVGSVGVTTHGRVNRDGIGAVVQLTPFGGETAMQPVLGGSGYAQQDSLTQHFGMGEAGLGQVDVLWPGAVRNRLHFVRSGQTVTFPEIPCSIDTEDSFPVYLGCVLTALRELRTAGVIRVRARNELLASAILGYLEER